MASMTFEFLDVGMGDSTLVMMGTSASSTQELALVDFGIQPFTQNKVGADDAMIYLVNTINKNSDDRGLKEPFIDHLFITHGDQDHYNRIEALIN
ncbi:MAG: MBL fold metallo-hydrolase, partial [bacterium]